MTLCGATNVKITRMFRICVNSIERHLVATMQSILLPYCVRPTHRINRHGSWWSNTWKSFFMRLTAALNAKHVQQFSIQGQLCKMFN
jgi:hypothetical protein